MSKGLKNIKHIPWLSLHAHVPWHDHVSWLSLHAHIPWHDDVPWLSLHAHVPWHDDVPWLSLHAHVPWHDHVPWLSLQCSRFTGHYIHLLPRPVFSGNMTNFNFTSPGRSSAIRLVSPKYIRFCFPSFCIRICH